MSLFLWLIDRSIIESIKKNRKSYFYQSCIRNRFSLVFNDFWNLYRIWSSCYRIYIALCVILKLHCKCYLRFEFWITCVKRFNTFSTLYKLSRFYNNDECYDEKKFAMIKKAILKFSVRYWNSKSSFKHIWYQRNFPHILKFTNFQVKQYFVLILKKTTKSLKK